MKQTLKFIWAVVTAFALANQANQAQSIADGLKAFDQERFAEARKTFYDLYGKAQTAENAYYLGYFYLRMDNADSAKIFFEQGIAADAKYPMNYVGRGAVKYTKKDKTGAKTDFEQALTVSKRKNADVMHHIGEAYIMYNEKDPSAAIDILYGNKTAKQKGAKDLAPQNAEILLTLGDAFLERNSMITLTDGNNDGGNAANCYANALKINPKMAKAYMKKGDIWVRAKNYKLALEDYKKGVEVNPDYAPVYRGLGELYARAQRYKEATQYYADYIKRSDGSVEALYRYAQFLFAVSEYAKSSEMLDKIEGKVTSPNFHRLRAYNQYETKEFPASAKSMELFLSKTATDKLTANDYQYKGRITLANGGDTLKATEDLHKSVELDSSRLNTHKELFEMFFKGKKYKAAAQEMVLYTAKKKTDPNDFIDLGRAYLSDKNYALADSAFVQSNRVQESSTAYYWRASAAEQMDKDAKEGLSKPHWERYIELADKNNDKVFIARAYYALARIEGAKGDAEKTEALANKALEMDPNNKNAKKMLEQLAEAKKGGGATNTPPKKEEKKK